MMDHVENVHLRQIPADKRIICHYPIYKVKVLVLNNVINSKKRVATVYKD